MRRYILVGLPKELDNHLTISEFRTKDRERYVYQAVHMPPNGGVRGGTGGPNSPVMHPVFVSDREEEILAAAKAAAETHPNFQWCTYDLMNITTGTFTEIKVTTKKITEKGMLP